MKIGDNSWMATEGILDGTSGSFVYGALGLVSMVIALGSCLWCRHKWTKFKEWPNQRHHNHSNSSTVPPNAEFSEFPIQPNMHLTSINTLSPAILDEIVFEPLPEIRSRSLQAVAQNIRPARFSGLSKNISLQDWFDEQQLNFPRNQLKYLKEVGSAWYGQAVEGEAYNMLAWQEKTQIVVKILRVDATVLEYMQFLNEMRALRDLRHPHLLRLIGRCLEVHPFLLIMEHCSIDLKTYLIQQRSSSESFLRDGLALRNACDIASALHYMHDNGYIHSDIACHSCLVTSSHIVKIGDYGTALFAYKSDYYCLGDIAFPLRWCAPESLHCNESIIEAKDITKEANVWSFGVLLWELLEFGKLPYIDYTDDEVVQKVIIESTLKLEQPKTPGIHKHMMFNIMQLCWLPSSHRPSMQKIITLLNYLYDNRDVVSESAAFESRWNTLQPVLKNHNLAHLNTTTTSSFRFENDFNSKCDPRLTRDCDSIMSSEFSPSHYDDKSPSRGSFSTGYEGSLLTEISPSLQNLRGSIGDLTVASSSTNEESDIDHTKLGDAVEDSDSMQATIKEAIRDLDSILAGELTSSDTSKCNTPDRYPSGNFEISEAGMSTATTSLISLVNGVEIKDDHASVGSSMSQEMVQNGSIQSDFTSVSDSKPIKNVKYQNDSDLGFTS